MRHVRALAAATLIPILAGGCDTDSALTPRKSPPEVSSHFALGVNAPLGADGRLQLAAAPSGRHPRIDGATALQLARQAVVQIGPFILPALEIQHGASIDLRNLVADPRPLFVASPYAELPADAHRGLRNLYGPYYVVYFGTAAGNPVLSVAVAAHTDARIVNGRMVTGPQDGNDIMIEGLPREKGEYAPVTPERAVELVASATRGRVAAVPELVGPGRMFVPQLGRWRIALDRPVNIRGRDTGRQAAVRELYVGLWGEIESPRPGQPSTVSVPSVGRMAEMALPRLAHVPVEFEKADILDDN